LLSQRPLYLLMKYVY
jgi:serine/threonine protein kinase